MRRYVLPWRQEGDFAIRTMLSVDTDITTTFDYIITACEPNNMNSTYHVVCEYISQNETVKNTMDNGDVLSLKDAITLIDTHLKVLGCLDIPSRSILLML